MSTARVRRLLLGVVLLSTYFSITPLLADAEHQAEPTPEPLDHILDEDGHCAACAAGMRARGYDVELDKPTPGATDLAGYFRGQPDEPYGD